MLAKAFANGGSSLTGIEAVSNAVSALRPPEGRNARQILDNPGLDRRVPDRRHLLAGAHHPRHPVQGRVPDGARAGGQRRLRQRRALHVLRGAGGYRADPVHRRQHQLQRFPVTWPASSPRDSFLPRWLTKRGHRLALSNGIIVLTVVSLVLLVATRAVVNGLIPFYAIGVFTGFTMAGFGMARYHKRVKERGWRRSRIINGTAAVYTALVVVIFAVVKFTEGAWLIVIIFPVLVFLLIRLNREYRMEAEVLENIGDRRAAGIPPRQPNYSRRVVLIFVDDVDLATLAAIRYARGLRPTTLRAVHFVIDSARAQMLHEKWVRFGQDIPLEMIDTPDRRLTRASRRTGQPRGRAEGHPGHRRAAAARLLAAARPPAARPHGGQDRRSGQPGAERRRHDHPVRRGEPGPPAACPAGRPPRGAAATARSPATGASAGGAGHAGERRRSRSRPGEGSARAAACRPCRQHRADSTAPSEATRRRTGARRLQPAPRRSGRSFRDQRAERRAEGDRRGQGPVGGDPPGREQLRVRRHDRGRDRGRSPPSSTAGRTSPASSRARASGSPGRCPCAKAARP